MSQRYPLRNTLSGKPPVRRLSPTAVRNTGPLPRPGGPKEDTRVKTDGTGAGLDPAHSADTPSTVMPAEPPVDAAEPEASGNVASDENDDPGSSLTSLEPDDYDYRSTTGLSPNDVDKITDKTLRQDKHAPDENVRISPEDTDIDGADTSKEKPPRNKGKGIDPGNWGNLELDESELDPHIQQEILDGCRQPPNQGKGATQKPVPDETRTTGDPAESGQEEPESDETVITRKELLRYLRDRKMLRRLLDQHEKKRASARSKRGDRAKSAPLSDELETLIKRVAEGSSKKAQYKPTTPGGKRRGNAQKSTDPISQITAKSALGRAFQRIGRRDDSYSSDDDKDPSSPESESESSESSSEEEDTTDSSSTTSSSGEG
ncbi:hypothetical protein C0993_011475, partial [Termitomyces sp. T159_Od127]